MHYDISQMSLRPNEFYGSSPNRDGQRRIVSETRGETRRVRDAPAARAGKSRSKPRYTKNYCISLKVSCEGTGLGSQVPGGQCLTCFEADLECTFKNPARKRMTRSRYVADLSARLVHAESLVCQPRAEVVKLHVELDTQHSKNVSHSSTSSSSDSYSQRTNANTKPDILLRLISSMSQATYPLFVTPVSVQIDTIEPRLEIHSKSPTQPAANADLCAERSPPGRANSKPSHIPSMPHLDLDLFARRLPPGTLLDDGVVGDNSIAAPRLHSWSQMVPLSLHPSRHSRPSLTR
ncbi:hypothetical protein B0H11DRAFT_2375361 [Mycena galericulata]|nr:hypothetical protein B0H11DRAFT_2375361 [Mycena galericulata]